MSAPGSNGGGWNGLSSSLGPSASQYIAESRISDHSDDKALKANIVPPAALLLPVEADRVDFEETPGRPSESISEYADAYVQMMNDRDSGRPLGNSVITPRSEDVEAPQARSSSPVPSAQAPAAQPSQAPLQPLLPPPSDHSSSQSRVSPVSSPHSSVPLGFGPSHTSSPSSSAPPRAEPIAHPLGGSVGVPSSAARQQQQRASRANHRRRASHGGAMLVEEYEMDSDHSDDDYDDDEMDAPPRGGRRSASRTAAGSKSNGSRPSASSSSQQAAQSSAPRNSAQWHSRKNSTSSARSGNSDPASRAYSRASRPYNGVGPNSAASASSSPPPPGPASPHLLSRSGNLTPTQHSQTTIQMQKTRSTLFYIRRRIHCMRAASIFMLVCTLTLSLAPYINLSVVLGESQANRNTCQAPLIPSTSTPAVPIPVRDSCFYFQHDMTSFLVVSGLWLGLGIGLSVMSVAASFMFYWRRFMRITLVSSITMCFVTVIVMTWAIVLLSFSYEWENWRGDNNSMSRNNAHHNSAVSLRDNSLVFLVAVCIFWILNFIVSVICVHLSKFIMSKPRHCCWPLECGPTQVRTKAASMPTISNRNGLEGPYSVPVDRRGTQLDDSLLDHDDNQHDMEEMPDISIKPVPVKRPSADDRSPQKNASKPHPSAAQQPPAQDLAPLLNALQGIQSTVHSLAAKVQAIEDKEATSSAAADLNDPFAYGRRF